MVYAEELSPWSRKWFPVPGSPFRIWDALLDTLLGVVPSSLEDTGSPAPLRPGELEANSAS